MVSTNPQKKIIGLIINEIYPKELDRFLINDLRKENIDFFLVDISKVIYKKNHNKNFADISINCLDDLNSILEVNDYFILYFDYTVSGETLTIIKDLVNGDIIDVTIKI